MKFLVKTGTSCATLIASLAVATWSPHAYACSDTPVLASICVMAVPFTFGSFNRQFVLAAGQDLSINTYTALYSLIGTTYGTSSQSTFKLPDLRGKFVVGAGITGVVNYEAGDTGGNDTITLTTAQLPIHAHALTTVPVDLTKATVTSVLPTLSGTANIASSVAAGTVSGLKMNVVSGGAGSTPSGNYLGKPSSAAASPYSSLAPDVTLNAGAISGGTVSVTVPASTANLTIAGGGTVAGTVGGTAAASGTTKPAGGSAAIDIRPSYIALTYYIAANNGLYPSRD